MFVFVRFLTFSYVFIHFLTFPYVSIFGYQFEGFYESQKIVDNRKKPQKNVRNSTKPYKICPNSNGYLQFCTVLYGFPRFFYDFLRLFYSTRDFIDDTYFVISQYLLRRILSITPHWIVFFNLFLPFYQIHRGLILQIFSEGKF